MSIKIYTYADPYEISSESFWKDIQNCAHFCVSQTMANGLKSIYPGLGDHHQLGTVRNLINGLYENWEDMNTKVRQMVQIDNAILRLTLEGNEQDEIRRSLQFNIKPIAESIRLFSELDMHPDDLDTKNLVPAQRYVVELYKDVYHDQESAFAFKHVTEKKKLEEAINQAIKGTSEENYWAKLDQSTIVIHGVHQFTPSILCAIDDLSKYFTVVLLFNYQSQYSTVYQSWMDIYSLFDVQIITSDDNQSEPLSLMADSYASNVLGDSIGKLSSGERFAVQAELKDLEVVEFENITEFANYAAMLFENARDAQIAEGGKKQPLYYMKEQMYATSSKVNDILRAYFPEQFGERHFLDYPLGHFFVAAVNMWDDDNQSIRITDFSDLRECLSAGIVSESKPGLLISTLNTVEPYIENESLLERIIKRLSSLTKFAGKSNADEKGRVGYFSVSKSDLQELIQALKELKTILLSFFEHSNDSSESFKVFYSRVRKFLTTQLNSSEDMDEEMRTVISQLLERLQRIDLPESGTFNCLKQTMNYYLSQNDNMMKGAQWIVRGFEQIDGDILRSAGQDAEKTSYHFCCLSDKGMCASRDESLPWPLDLAFFQKVQLAQDRNYRIYVQSKTEYHNYNRYAFVYGLVFNRVGCRLSYIKTEDNKDNDVYHMLSLLGIRVRKYKAFGDSTYQPKLVYKNDAAAELRQKLNFTDVDRYKYAMCPYRFALEKVVQGGTIFRDRFLIHTYMRVLVSNRVKEELEQQHVSDSQLKAAIQSHCQSINDKFKISDEVEMMQIRAAVFGEIKKYWIDKNGRMKKIGNKYKELKLREDLLFTSLKEITDLPDDKILEEQLTETKELPEQYGAFCKYCASKDICLFGSEMQEV